MAYERNNTVEQLIPNPMPETPRVLIGVPILAWTHEFAMSFLEFWTDLMTYQHKGYAFQVSYKFAYRRPVHMAEEELAEFAVRTGATHLLLMDDDIYGTKAKDLVTLLKAEKDVIGGVMHTSTFPFTVCAFRRYDLKTRLKDQPILHGPARLYEIPEESRKGVQEADLIPFGFTLIKTSIFNKIPKPWFRCDTVAPTDSWFMDSIMEQGVQPYVHFDVWLNHRGVTQLTRPFMHQMELAKAQAQQNSTQLIMLDPKTMNQHSMMMDIKLKEAEKARVLQEVSEQKFMLKQEGDGIATPLEVAIPSTAISTPQ